MDDAGIETYDTSSVCHQLVTGHVTVQLMRSRDPMKSAALGVGAVSIALAALVAVPATRKRISALLFGDAEGEYQAQLQAYVKTQSNVLAKDSKVPATLPCASQRVTRTYPHDL